MVLIQKNAAYVAWLVAIISTVGSLYFSEVMSLPPCVLCWYQRIFMYPLVILLAIGIAKKDKNLPEYVFPLGIVGMGIALYHYLLQLGIIPDNLGPCTLGVSCTSKYIEWFGFITIPLLSLAAFAIITACMVWLKKEKRPA